MKNITNLQNDARICSYRDDVYNADVVKGVSIRIHGVDANRVGGPRDFDRTFRVGERAVYDSYNLVYTGAILSITEKTVTIDADSTGQRTKRLPLAVFVKRNYGRSMEEIDAHNATESQCI